MAKRDDRDMVAAFLADGGKLTKCPTGARTMTSCEMRAAVRGELTRMRKKPKSKPRT
jgi:hypothetical protein